MIPVCHLEAPRFLQRDEGSRAVDFDDLIPTEAKRSFGNFNCVLAKTFILTRSSQVQTITRSPFRRGV